MTGQNSHARASSGRKSIADDFLKRLLASKFPADYTDQRYAITSASTEFNYCETPPRSSVIRLCVDPGDDVAGRALHRGEGQTDHAACLGNAVCLDLVAFYVKRQLVDPRLIARIVSTPGEMIDMQGSWRRLLQRVHRDERGAVSLETILIVAAIALPILIYILKFGWPMIKKYFETGIQNLENEGSNVTNGTNGGGTGTR